jgi:hypothetical protein
MLNSVETNSVAVHVLFLLFLAIYIAPVACGLAVQNVEQLFEAELLACPLALRIAIKN